MKRWSQCAFVVSVCPLLLVTILAVTTASAEHRKAPRKQHKAKVVPATTTTTSEEVSSSPPASPLLSVPTRSKPEESSGVGYLVFGLLVALISIPIVILNRRAQQRAAQMRAEAAAAPQLFEIQRPRDRSAEVRSLLDQFAELRTFEDVVRWDAGARKVAWALDDEREEVGKRIEEARAVLTRYQVSNADAPHVSEARIGKALEQIARVQAFLTDTTTSIDELLERVDLTPDNAKEQRAILKSLREQRRELQTSKKEARASMADIRREARAAAADAAPSPWDSSYSRKQSAEERRAIRNAKESALRPHEGQVAAIERQMIALDRRISWVQRFGDDES